jgi:hypothetical protein
MILLADTVMEDAEFLSLFKLDHGHLEEQQKIMFEQLLLKNKKVFARANTDLGCATNVKHHIEMDDYTPIKERYRRIPPAMFEAVRQEIHDMLAAGVIRESHSPWCAPVTIVTKKDGSPRICIDFRKANARTTKDAKSLPRINETLDALTGAKVFSSLDLQSGYWQVEVEEECKQFTAFTAGPLGFWEFNRMPFGQVNSGATFQRLMEQVLEPLLYRECLVYVDDVIVYSEDFTSHLGRLQRVFDKLYTCGLKLKPKKCHFFKQEIAFLGHVVSSTGIKKDDEKVKTIRNWPTPTSVKEVRQFLGLTGYLRKYVSNYAIIAKPLTELLKGYSNQRGSKAKNKQLEATLWKWDDDEMSSF